MFLQTDVAVNGLRQGNERIRALHAGDQVDAAEQEFLKVGDVFADHLGEERIGARRIVEFHDFLDLAHLGDGILE